MSSSSAVPVALIVLTGAIGVGAASQATDMPQDLEEHIDRLLEDTMRDLTVRWLEVPHATGVVENDTIVAADMLVRLDGGAERLDLEETLVLGQNATERPIANASTVRDEDGSMEERAVTRGDLVRLQIPFVEPMEEREERTLLLEAPGKASLELSIESPRSIQGQHPTLEVHRTG